MSAATPLSRTVELLLPHGALARAVRTPVPPSESLASGPSGPSGPRPPLSRSPPGAPRCAQMLPLASLLCHPAVAVRPLPRLPSPPPPQLLLLLVVPSSTWQSAQCPRPQVSCRRPPHLTPKPAHSVRPGLLILPPVSERLRRRSKRTFKRRRRPTRRQRKRSGWPRRLLPRKLLRRLPQSPLHPTAMTTRPLHQSMVLPRPRSQSPPTPPPRVPPTMERPRPRMFRTVPKRKSQSDSVVTTGDPVSLVSLVSPVSPVSSPRPELRRAAIGAPAAVRAAPHPVLVAAAGPLEVDVLPRSVRPADVVTSSDGEASSDAVATRSPRPRRLPLSMLKVGLPFRPLPRVAVAAPSFPKLSLYPPPLLLFQALPVQVPSETILDWGLFFFSTSHVNIPHHFGQGFLT